MRRHPIMLAILSIALLGATPFPATIDLPAGIAGEGIAVGEGTTFYAGSLTTGFIARGDIRSGTSEIWVDDPAVVPAVGLWADVRHGLLFVAGGPSGQGAAYETSTGDAATTFTFAPGFINDVVATRDAAYFTNSFAPEIYRVPISPTGDLGDPDTIQLTGPASDDFVPGAFNLNGIEATADGKTLVIVNSTAGTLYTVDPGSGETAAIDLGGGDVTTGDGILLTGHTLFVLQNGTAAGIDNQVAVIRLSADLSAGGIVDVVTDPAFETATTLARHGDRLVAVNAQFLPPPIDAEFEVVVFRAR